MDEAMLILSMFQYFIQGYIQLVIFLHYPSSLDGSSIDDTFPEKKSEDFEKVKGRHTILLPHMHSTWSHSTCANDNLYQLFNLCLLTVSHTQTHAHIYNVHTHTNACMYRFPFIFNLPLSSIHPYSVS